MADLLIELFSEEIPARMQARAAADFKRLVTGGLVDAGLAYAGAAAFATPRRLALSVEGLDAASRDLHEERKGPAVGAPEAALQGFLRATGLTQDELEQRDTARGAVWFAVTIRPGRPAADIVAEVLENTIRNFPWPKSMRWGAGSLRWVRPLQSVLCILTDENGAQVVPFEIDGIVAGNCTRGHRFMAPDAFAVASAADYEARLLAARVVLRAERRADTILHDATNAAFAQGLELVADDALLAEVAGLVEWPVVLMGSIGAEFLHLPPEVLQTSMREHQKFFSVKNPATGRIERFVTVANIETEDAGRTILHGNSRVLAARLSDAHFFWDNDLRVARAGMGDWAEGLKSVTFHRKLGSQAERVDRIAALAREIAPAVGADAEQAERAARLAKLDLRSEMVGEFPELQGVMGRYYALEAGEPEAVADAVRDHYAPLGPSNAVPSAPVSVAVALADKIDTLAGFWAIDEKPTGSKDPFALRRAALGVIRLVLGNEVRLPLLASFAAARADCDGGDLLSFLHDRLKVHLRDEGIRHDIIDAVLALPGNDDLTLVVKRARALAAFLKTDDGENLLQGYSRANNILAQAESRDGVEYSFGADPKFAETPEEQALFVALDAAQAAITPLMQAEDFAAAMEAMARLRAPIDAFFEAVQINTDNAVLRRNRLNLLGQIRSICAGVADFTKIEG
ncbi:MAG: glycine--tRNA ligase subunit beta [Rubellimicrobium sp.]|nr:glycine--tRNA ligase subunit beta [Rubellimicrobium sp.]